MPVFRITEFWRYVAAGGLATVVDWGCFYLLVMGAGIHYQGGVVCAFTLGSIANYALNKVFAFRCGSKRIAGQLAVHALISLLSLLLSMCFMYIFVDVMKIYKMVSRMGTSVIMVVINYFAHRNITFNRKVFS